MPRRGVSADRSNRAAPGSGPGARGNTSAPWPRAALAAAAAAAGLAAILHLNALGGAFVYDDVAEIRDNPDIRRLSFVFETFGGEAWTAARGYGFTYRPVSWAAAAILYALGGGYPLPFHLANLLLHALNAALVALLAGRLLEEGLSPPRPLLLAPGAAAALLFAAHPVHTEAVAWASGRSDLLAAAGLLGAWLLHVSSRGGLRAEIASALLLLAAILAKETAAAGVLLIPLGDLVKEAARGSGLRAALRSVRGRAALLHAAALGVALAARWAALGRIGRGTVRGAVLLNPLEGAGPLDRILTGLALIPEHLRLLLWPARLSLEYSFDQIPKAGGLLDARLVPALVLAIGAAGAIAARARWGPAALGLAALYAAAALPTSNLVVLPAAIFSERYLYLPSAVACAAAGLALATLARSRRGAAAAALAAILAAGSLRTLDRNRDWRDAESLYRSSLAAAPRAARLHYNLGVVLREQDRAEESEASFRRALEIAPAYADARAELGLALVRRGRLEEAMAELGRAAADAPEDPVVLNNLGGAYLTAGRTADAVRLFRRALSLDPRHYEAMGNLGKAALDAGDLAEARRSFEAMAAAFPDDAAARVGLGAVEASAGSLTAAAARFREALERDPANDEAAFNLGAALLGAGDPAAAVRVLGSLAARRPDDAQAAALLARARAAAAAAPGAGR
jgi:tetratricopeptide (TPR) repeat protein